MPAERPDRLAADILALEASFGALEDEDLSLDRESDERAARVQAMIADLGT
jgi:hypothetical protein